MKFLLAVDGSDASDAALDHVVELARGLDASVTVVHAVEPGVIVDGHGPADGPIAGDQLVSEAIGDAEARAERIVDEAVARLESAGVDAEAELLYGDPTDVIPDFAAAESFDGLFVGHRGLSERYESLVGSVAKAIVERSSVPVTVVR